MGVDQNSPPVVHWAIYTFNRTPPPIFHFPYFFIHALNKNFPSRGKGVQKGGGGYLIPKVGEGNLNPKVGGNLRSISIPDLGV